MSASPGLHRVLPRTSARIALRVDDETVEAFDGESLLVAVLTHAGRLRQHEASGSPRAGFCLMGACQDCWVWLPDGHRLRACTTPVRAGMAVLTRPPGAGLGTGPGAGPGPGPGPGGEGE